MGSLAQLERLLNNDAALQQAQRSQNYAQNTQRLLQQPLSNFNPGSLRDPAGVPSLERLQGSIRVQQYMDSGAIRHMPAPNPPNVSPGGGGGGGGARILPTSANATLSPTQAATQSASAPAQIRIPTTAQLGRQLRNIAPTLGRSALTGLGQGALLEGSIRQQGLNDSLNDQLRNQLPSGLQPNWDRLAGPGGALEQWLSPPNISAPRDGIRLLDDFQNRIPQGLPPRSQAGQLGQQLNCAIFGVGCPTTSPEGVPNLGSPGAEPPFRGGQMPGRYVIEFECETKQRFVDEYQSNVGSFYAWGRIQDFGVQKFEGANEFGEYEYKFHGRFGTPSNPDANEYADLGSQLTRDLRGFRITRIYREDGQPDTGGNPAPQPGAALMPPSVPPLVNPLVRPPANPPTRPDTGVPSPPTTPVSPPTPAPPETAPPEVKPPDSDPDSPLSPLNPGTPLFPGIRPVSPPSGQKGFNPSGASQPSQASGRGTGTGTKPTSPTCFYDSANIKGGVDQANTTLTAVQLFMEQQMMSKLNTIDTKLGPQIPNGGVSGFLGKMFDFAKKSWNFLQVDRVLNILTWIGVMHNAYMLSNGLAQTLFSAIGNALDVFGIEDADGNTLNVGAIVASWTDNFFKSIFGVSTVNGIKEAWKKFNRIYQAAANIIFSIQSITFAMVEMLEVISNYVGRIGNALRKAGGVLENAYSWMNPNANYTNNRFFNALNNTQEAVEAIDQVASETLSVQETGAELFNQKQEFDNAVDDAENFVNDQESAAKGASSGVTINPSDERKPE